MITKCTSKVYRINDGSEIEIWPDTEVTFSRNGQQLDQFAEKYIVDYIDDEGLQLHINAEDGWHEMEFSSDEFDVKWDSTNHCPCICQ